MKSVYHVYLSVIRGALLKRTDMNYSHLRFFGSNESMLTLGWCLKMLKSPAPKNSP
jgi:hypothetical protein